MANQLRAELERLWPGAIEIFADIDSLIGLAFLERYPSPLEARGLGAKRLAAFLARHRYSGHKPPDELLAKLRAAPEGRAGEQEVRARRAIVLALVAALRPIVAKISELTSEIAQRVRAHPDGEIFLSLFKNPSSHHPHPVGAPPRPPATQRMLGAAVTQPAVQPAEREALDGRPPSTTTPRG